MKIYILTAFFVFIVFNSYTQAPLNYWAHGFGGSGTDYGYNVAMSANTGDIFITGYFSGVSSFGSDIELISSGYEDVYILKLTKKGSLLWAVKAGGDSLDVGKNIVLDEAGNIYIVGYFKSSSLDFGNGIMIQSSGLEDIFIAKYNSSGQCIWAKGFGNNKLDQGYGIAYQTNTLYISGTFTDTIDFGNGIEINSSSPAGRDIFWAKFDIDGNCLLAKGAGSVYTDHSNSIYVDNFENVFITGYFEDTAYFDSYFVVSNGQSDIFLAQYNSVGQCNWVTGIGDSLDDYGKALVTDNYGNCYLTGNFADNPDFGNGNVL
ncbi:MAG: hypothetical protein HY738_09950 [Bacteroidia bacterium]|nr:hypothetical protein [Bacteroidia bacterium]